MLACVFLDRDNTLIANDGDLGDPAAVELLAGAAAAVKMLADTDYALVVVTNQGGVARGKYTEEDVAAVHLRCEALLAADAQWHEGRPMITKWMSCPFHPDGSVERYRREHPWRKPEPGMLLAAAAELSVDLSKSWMVGDQPRDIEAGSRAGCRTILVHADPSTRSEAAMASAADFVESSLFDAARRILRADGRDAAPRWAQTSGARLTANSGSLEDPLIRQMIATTAGTIARDGGITLLKCVVDPSSVEIEVIGPAIVAIGFAAELRRSTNAVSSTQGLGPLWVSE